MKYYNEEDFQKHKELNQSEFTSEASMREEFNERHRTDGKPYMVKEYKTAEAAAEGQRLMDEIASKPSGSLERAKACLAFWEHVAIHKGDHVSEDNAEQWREQVNKMEQAASTNQDTL